MKTKPIFSLKTYLLKKAQKKLALMQHRASKREQKAELVTKKQDSART